MGQPLVALRSRACDETHTPVIIAELGEAGSAQLKACSPNSGRALARGGSAWPGAVGVALAAHKVRSRGVCPTARQTAPGGKGALCLAAHASSGPRRLLKK